MTMDTAPTGKLLHLPVNTLAGDAAALRTELVAQLRERCSTVVDEMADALQRSGLAPVLRLGEFSVTELLDAGQRIALAAWEDHRPISAAELDAIAALGNAVARAEVPLYRLLSAVQQAARAGWQFAVEMALALEPGSRRSAAHPQLVADLSVELFELVGRIECQLAVGHGDHAAQATPQRRPA